MLVFQVALEVNRQFADLFGEQRNLNRGRAGVILVLADALYGARFLRFGEHQENVPQLSRFCKQRASRPVYWGLWRL